MKKFTLTFSFYSLSSLIILIIPEFPGLKFYSGDEAHDYSCNFFMDQPVNIDCACVDGLWILYNSCEDENVTLAGNNHCTFVNGAPAISKGVQLLKSRDDVSIIDPDGSVRQISEENARGIIVDSQSALVVGSEWRILDTTGAVICLSLLEPDSYCLFTNLEENYWEIDTMEQGCDAGYDYFIDPSICYKTEGKLENICERSEIKRRFKREDAGDAAAAPASDGAGGSGTNFTGITPDDEDYLIYNETLEKGDNASESSSVNINSGIMEYMSDQLDIILSGGISDSDMKVMIDSSMAPRRDDTFLDADAMGGNPLNVTYTNPVYEYLELSKRIMQMTCPRHYVNPAFLNLAVATFIQMQQIKLKFPEQSFKPSGFRRILNALRRCEANAKPFNFSDADCDGKVDGNYSMFGQTLELTIGAAMVDYSRDPIIETVWKIFFNAHSYCYPYFNRSLDHHRFATWMIPLFQNEMNKIWTEGNTTEKSLSGLFGNQIEVQANLGYCAVSSRLDSKYPWDLPRPHFIAEFGGESNKTEGEGAGAAPPPAGDGGRRKREIDFILVNVDEVMNTATCVDSTKSLLCPTHMKSIIPLEEEFLL